MTPKNGIALVTVSALLVGISACADTGARDRSASSPRADAPARTTTTWTSEAGEQSRLQLERPPVRLAATRTLRLSRPRRNEAVNAAQDFAVSLTRWLYGERKRLDVEPVTRAVRRELASSPPYIPPDQRGTGEGRVQLLELALQTERSGIVTVTINDLRTSYRIPTALELRAGRWQIVHLNTH